MAVMRARIPPGHTLVCLMALLLLPVGARNATIYNDRPRRATDGSYVDAHDGLVLAVNGT